MEFAVAALALLVVVLVGYGIRAGMTRTARPPAAATVQPAPEVHDGRATLTLDVPRADPKALATQRLIDDAADQVFAAVPEALEVEVRDRGGAVLGRRRREAPRRVAIPVGLYEPHVARRTAPSPDAGLLADRGERAVPGANRDVDPGERGHRALADRFDLPEAVRTRLGDADDAVALVRSLLESGGRSADVDGDVIRTGGEAVVVIRAPIGEPVSPERLNRAYLRFRESGAAQGVVLTPGFMHPGDLRRREAHAPELLHAGPEGIQRMADAVAVGADPLRFAAAPHLVAGRR